MEMKRLVMVSAEKESFVKLLIAAAELYNKQISDVLVKIYWKVLQLYALQDVAKAFEIHFEDPDSGQYMPKPADIVRVIKGNSQSQCLQAWSKVEQAIRLVGPYQTVVFDDEVIHAVIHEMGGWIKICQSTQREFPFIGKEFQTRYNAYRYNRPNSYPKALTGLSNHQNSLDGYESEPPCLIGDVEKAHLILEQGTSGSALIKINQVVPKALENNHKSKKEMGYARTTALTSQA